MLSAWGIGDIDSRNQGGVLIAASLVLGEAGQAAEVSGCPPIPYLVVGWKEMTEMPGPVEVADPGPGTTSPL